MFVFRSIVFYSNGVRPREIKEEFAGHVENNGRAKIRLLNSQLTDTNFFNVANGFEPVKITRGHIYLNKTVSSEIDKTFTEIKDLIFNMKISVNDM